MSRKTNPTASFRPRHHLEVPPAEHSGIGEKSGRRLRGRDHANAGPGAASERPIEPPVRRKIGFRRFQVSLLECGTPGPIRTADLLLRRLKISITYEHRLLKIKDLGVRALDPDGPKFGGFRRFGPSPDPPHWRAFHVLFARTRAVAWPSEFLSKICCSDRIFKSPYRDSRATRLRSDVGAAVSGTLLAG